MIISTATTVGSGFLHYFRTDHTNISMTFVPSVHVFLSIFAIWSACVSIVYDYQAYSGQQAIVGPTWGYGWSCWPNVGSATTHQRWVLSSGVNDGPTHAYRL